MRYVTLCSLLFMTAILFAAQSPVSAAGWCLLSSSGTLCRFQTFEQCMASRVISSDTCNIDQITPQPQGTKKTSGAATAKKRETVCVKGFHREGDRCVADSQAVPSPSFSIQFGLGLGGGGRSGGGKGSTKGTNGGSKGTNGTGPTNGTQKGSLPKL
jgi:hypothetical protein